MIAEETAGAAEEAGPVGPVAFCALVLLLAAAPLMRGGNRQVALIVLEALALAFLAAMATGLHRWRGGLTLRSGLLAFVCLSPLWLALVYLTPLPAALWNTLAGRGEYAGFLHGAGIAQPNMQALSLSPDATVVSLLAGLPMVAAFIAGSLCSPRQLRTVFIVVAVMAAVQTLFGLLQIAGGRTSALLLGAQPGRPVGTFANPNHFGNYIAMGLVAYLCVARMAREDRIPAAGARPGGMRDPHAEARRKVSWAAGAAFLVVGIIISLSRGALLAAMATAVAALLLAAVVRGRSGSWRKWALIGLGVVVAAAALVGVDAVLERFERAAAAADLRTLQLQTTLEGVAAFWPWGAGWGTYAAVYPRFQPPGLVGMAEYTHHDYAQMLFEGGIFALLLMAAFAALAAERGVRLARGVVARGRLRRHEVPMAICGLGLLGFLLHSLVEFNMHIPANAIVAALLAGVFLRPLPANGPGEGARA